MSEACAPLTDQRKQTVAEAPQHPGHSHGDHGHSHGALRARLLACCSVSHNHDHNHNHDHAEESTGGCCAEKDCCAPKPADSGCCAEKDCCTPKPDAGSGGCCDEEDCRNSYEAYGRSTVDCCLDNLGTVEHGGFTYHLIPAADKHDLQVRSCGKVGTSSQSVVGSLKERLHGKWKVFTADYLLAFKQETAVSVLYVDGVCCASEVPLVEKTLFTLAGVDTVTVNVLQKQARVTHAADKASAEEMAKALSGVGLKAKVLTTTAGSSQVTSVLHVDGICCASEVRLARPPLTRETVCGIFSKAERRGLQQCSLGSQTSCPWCGCGAAQPRTISSVPCRAMPQMHSYTRSSLPTV
jgi:copper chaperone CopZ